MVEASSSLVLVAADSAAFWYRQNGRRFVGRLKPAARVALETIVREGPLVRIERVREVTGEVGTALAGSLASIGAAWKALGAPSAPYKVDHKRGQYEIDEEVRVALLEVLNALS